jgi:hypothetical protein
LALSQTHPWILTVPAALLAVTLRFDVLENIRACIAGHVGSEGVAPAAVGA